MKTQSKCSLAAVCLVATLTLSASALVGVCEIGQTKYNTLQEAFNSMENASEDFTVKLLTDIDVASEITVPRFGRYVVGTVDGGGHTIRQAYAGRMFNMRTYYTYMKFKDVTILGGGETHSTASSDVDGVFFHAYSEAASLTLDTGCVVSNFVYRSKLVSTTGANVYVEPGCVIAHNRATASPGSIFYMKELRDGTALYIRGGEIFDNTAPNGTIACLSGYNKARTTPIAVISGGRIHDNSATASVITETALFFCDYGPIDVNMTGGEIFDNKGSVFHIRRGGSYLSRVHISGGKIFGNSGYAVCSYQAESVAAMLLSGDAIVAGNGTAGEYGLYQTGETTVPARTALEGDFTGFAYLTGQGGSAWTYHAIGKVYGTNLNHYAGAENIHLTLSDSPNSSKRRVLETDDSTGEMKWAEPNSAKIGETEYASFAAAFSAATDGATITLMRDYVCLSAIVPPTGKSITIDGAGHRILRCGNIHLVNATADGGDMTFTNVELNEGYFTRLDSSTNHADGVLVNTHDGVAATVTLGPGTVLSGGRGTNALVRVANGATVNLDGVVVTGQVNRAIAASVGGTLGVKGATIVKDNEGGDIDVADGGILSLNGNLTGKVHVTVAGAEACEGQQLGKKTGNWSGAENFINGGADPKLVLSKSDSVLVWCRRGFAVIIR